jgi:hypothetical protein
MFEFFLKSYRSGLLTFCGSKVDVEFDPNGNEGKYCFRQYENGEMKTDNLKSRHPNILKGLVIGKKSFGLWVDQYTDGINEWTFTKEEILEEFHKRNIKIPEPFLRDFNNVLERKRLKRIEEEIERLKNK